MSTLNNCILNRIFTKNTFVNILSANGNSIYQSILNEYIPSIENKTNLDVIREIYNIISTQYRNEYFYKNMLLNNILLGRHSINTTTALTEIPVGKSKADFIMINGKAQVYEIKTALDNFDRLESQIDAYYKAFDYVNVVTCEKNLFKVKAKVHNPCVGIILLTNKTNRLRTIREPIMNRKNLDIDTIFGILRKKEFEYIIIKLCGYLPNVPPVKYYDECLSLLKEINVNLVYDEFIKQLKMRSNINKQMFTQKVPLELRFLIYFSNYLSDDYKALEQFLEQECVNYVFPLSERTAI